MSPQIIFWLAAIIIFAIAEAATAGLVSIWFVAGSLAALVAAMAGGSVWLQIILFLVVSAAALVITRPLVKKYMTPKKENTNSDRYVGKTGIVSEDIDNIKATGAVKVSGVEWTARSENGEPIPKGSLVTTTRIDGAKLYVKPAEVTQTTNS